MNITQVNYFLNRKTEMFCTNQKIPAYSLLVMIPAGAFTPQNFMRQ